MGVLAINRQCRLAFGDLRRQAQTAVKRLVEARSDLELGVERHSGIQQQIHSLVRLDGSKSKARSDLLGRLAANDCFIDDQGV